MSICRNTKTHKGEVGNSLQVFQVLQRHRVGVLSKLREVDRKGNRRQGSVLITSLYILMHILGCIHHHQFSYFLILLPWDNLYTLCASSHFSFNSLIWTEVCNKPRDACQHCEKKWIVYPDKCVCFLETCCFIDIYFSIIRSTHLVLLMEN